MIKPLLTGLVLTLLACILSPQRTVGQEDDPERAFSRSAEIFAKAIRVREVPAEKARLFLDLALAYVRKPGENAPDLDSAQLLIREAEKINSSLHDKTVEARTLFVRSNTLREKGDTAEGHLIIKKAIENYKNLSLPAELAESWLELSNYYMQWSEENLSFRRSCYEQALPLFRIAGLREKQADALKNIADFNQVFTEYGKALIELKESLTLYQSIGFKKLQGVYDLLDMVSAEMGDYAGAVEYGLMAERIALSLPDTTMQLCTIYSRLAYTYNRWNKKDEALLYLQKALVVAKRYHDPSSIYLTTSGICTLLTSGGRWQESITLMQQTEKEVAKKGVIDALSALEVYIAAYLKGRQYDDAGRYMAILQDSIRGKPVEYLADYGTYNILISYFIGTGDTRRAAGYAGDFLKYSRMLHDDHEVAAAYLYLSKIDSAQSDFRSALVNFKRYKEISDSLLDDTKTFQFAQVHIANETRQKEDSLKEIQQNVQFLQIRNDGLRKEGVIRNIVIGAVSVLLILLYIGYLYKQRSNERLTRQQAVLRQTLTEKDKLVNEKEWLVREIHHRVKNNLQIIISLLNAQSEYQDNPSALEALRVSRERLEAIAIIHQKLHTLDESSIVNMRSYIEEMVSNLKSGFTDTRSIRFQLEIQDLFLDISQAVPLGLILNEAITNSVKYAWPPGRDGQIHIGLSLGMGEWVGLKIADDGQGFPEGFDLYAGRSLGMELIRLFAEQLEANLTIVNNNGAEIRLMFNRPFFRGEKAGTE